MRTPSMFVVAIGLTLAGVSGAAAQTAATAAPKAYVDVNIAGQPQSVAVAASSTFPLFGETGATSFSQNVGKGLVFDGGGGYFVRKNLAVGVMVSLFTRSPAAQVSVAVPDPIAFNSFTVLAASPKLEHTELGAHVKLAYLLRINPKIDVVVSAGPSFVRLTKEVASGSVVSGTAQIAVATQTGTGVGANGGLDANYLFTPRLGGGLFVRYVRAQVDLPVATGVKVGGFQGGLGLRLRF